MIPADEVFANDTIEAPKESVADRHVDTRPSAGLDAIDDAILAIKQGRPIVVVDDEDRENEGDLIFAASAASPANVAFMIRHTSGYICVGMRGEVLDRLGLPPMTAVNEDRKGTAYAVSVDARDVETTGISAVDRSRTIRVLADSATNPTDLTRPGHVMPLRAVEGGVLRRAGHTEAAVDLAALAGLAPAGALCELVNDDGTMMRAPDCRRFADEHGLIMISIADLIKFRRRTEKQVKRVATTKLPTQFGDFTAVGYYFAINLRKDKALADVPVGLIGSNWGGTRIEPWTTPEGFKSVPALKDIADNLASFPSKDAKGNINHQTPLALYNAMIAPLVPYGIRGALWYQGESNNGEGMLYAEKMKALINGWRKLWNDETMPFNFVQIAPYRYNSTGLPFLWEAQLAASKIPGVGMALTTDISDIKDIHPKNKQEVGRRLALIALTRTYGVEGLVHGGPVYKSMRTEGGKARISFDGVAGGLKSRDGKELNHFTVAGADKKFVPAKAMIEGNEVVVSADGVSEITAVRFGWHELAEPNLANKEGLPAYPFRTDSWK